MAHGRYRGGARSGPARPAAQPAPAHSFPAGGRLGGSTGGGRKLKAKDRLPTPTYKREAAPGELVRIVIGRDPGAGTWPPQDKIPQDAKDRYKRDVAEWRERCALLPAGAAPPKRPKPPWKRILSLSVNDWDHVHFRQREKLREDILERVWEAIQAQQPPRFHRGRPLVFLVYYFRQNARRDWSNWTGKHILDAFRDWGLILDDNDKAIDNDRPLLLVDKENPRVELWILDQTAPASPEVCDQINAIRQKYRLQLSVAEQTTLDLEG